MDFGKLFQKALQFGPRVVALVNGVRDQFGGTKSGTEKAKIVFDALTNPNGDDAVEIIEGVTGRDVINDDNLAALTREYIEAAYQVEKLNARRKEIERLMKSLKGTGQPR